MTTPPPPPPRRVAFVSHSDCARHDTGWSHPDHQGRLPAVMRAVYQDMITLFDHLEEIEGRHATEEELHLVHTPEYLERVRGWVARAAEQGSPVEVEPGLVISESSWDAARAAVGSALTAVDSVLEGRATSAFVAARPPGAGAASDAAGGFALLNTVAIAARYVLERHGLGRVVVIEFAGCGGSAIRQVLAGEPRARVLSLTPEEPDGEVTAEGPSRRRLPAGSDGSKLLAELRRLLEASPADPSPGFVLVAAGFDVLAADPLGAFVVEPDDFHAITSELRAYADRVCAGRLVSILEGGYAPPELGSAVVQHLRSLADLPPAG